LMSSSGGKKLYCLNSEHAVPGNEYEEHRIVNALSAILMEQKKKKDFMEHASKLNDFITQLKMPLTRLIGPPPRFDNIANEKERKIQ